VPRGRRTGRRKVEGARRRGKSRREGWEPSSLPGDRRESGSMGFLSESDSKATSCCQAEMTPMRMGFHHHHKYDRMDGVHIHPPAPALHTACDQFLLLPQFDRERERERDGRPQEEQEASPDEDEQHQHPGGAPLLRGFVREIPGAPASRTQLSSAATASWRRRACLTCRRRPARRASSASTHGPWRRSSSTTWRRNRKRA
jgi:hypothetical protein